MSDFETGVLTLLTLLVVIECARFALVLLKQLKADWRRSKRG